MKLFITASFIVMLAALMVRCTYVLEGEAFREIDQNLEPVTTLQLTLDETDSDTIVLYKPQNLGWDFSTSMGNLVKVDLYLDNQLVATSSSPQGAYQWSHRIVMGVLDLRIVSTSTSATGSLADRYGLEERTASRSWKVVVDFTVPPTPVPLASTTAGGFQKISWEPFTHGNFVEYVVLMHHVGFDSAFVIQDSLQSSWINPWYIGGYPIQYQVSTRTQTATIESNEVTFQNDFNVQAEVRASDSTMLIKWNKVPYPGPFTKYEITDFAGGLYEINIPLDTSIRVKPAEMLFNYPVGAYVWGHSVSHPWIAGVITIPRPFNVPQLTPRPNTFGYNKAMDVVFGQYWFDSIKQFNSDFEIIATYPEYAAISYDTPYIYYANGLSIVREHLGTHEKETYDISAPTSPVTNLRVIRASSNNVVVYMYSAPGVSTSATVSHATVHDLTTDEVLTHHESNSIAPVDESTLRISDDARYLIVANKHVYEWTGEFYEQRWVIPNNVTLLGFRRDNTDEIMVASATFQFLDAQTGSILRSFAGPPSYVFQHYDPVSRALFFTTNESKTSVAVDALTGEHTIIKAWNFDHSDPDFVAGYYFDRDGYYFKALP